MALYSTAVTLVTVLIPGHASATFGPQTSVGVIGVSAGPFGSLLTMVGVGEGVGGGGARFGVNVGFGDGSPLMVVVEFGFPFGSPFMVVVEVGVPLGSPLIVVVEVGVPLGSSFMVVVEDGFPFRSMFIVWLGDEVDAISVQAARRRRRCRTYARGELVGLVLQ